MEEGDIVLCTVNKIVGTTVFVTIEGNKEGSINFSEVAPGRIRNIRSHVVPKKTIVCKVLRIKDRNIELSLRRVSQKEKLEKLKQEKQEKSYESILKSILGDKSKEIVKKIKAEEESLFEFFQEVKENSEKLEKFIEKNLVSKVLDILKAQKQKKAIIRREISLFTKKPNGIELIKKILGDLKEIKIKYISAGKYIFEIESEDPKKASQKLKNLLSEFEKTAKKEGLELSIKEK
jgi:translation initiation factor 2 alpha subunit (eIF-2alpha)